MKATSSAKDGPTGALAAVAYGFEGTLLDALKFVSGDAGRKTKLVAGARKLRTMGEQAQFALLTSTHVGKSGTQKNCHSGMRLALRWMQTEGVRDMTIGEFICLMEDMLDAGHSDIRIKHVHNG